MKKTPALLRLLSTLGIVLAPAAAHATYGNPASVFNSLQTPEIAATRSQAIADLQRLMAQQDAFLAPGHGTDCALSTFEEGQQAVMGPENYAAHLQAWRDQNIAPPTGIEYRLHVLSGNCPTNGLFNGLVEYSWLADSEYLGSNEFAFRTRVLTRGTTVYENGKLLHDIASYSSNGYKSYTVLTSGERIETKSEDFPPAQPSYTVVYPKGQNGLPPDVSVSYSIMDVPTSTGNNMVSVQRYRDGNRIVSEIYQDGKLTVRLHLKDGKMHGWSESFAINLRHCFQNGVEVKSLECPDT